MKFFSLNPRATKTFEKINKEEMEIYEEKKFKLIESTYMGCFLPYKIFQTEVKKNFVFQIFLINFLKKNKGWKWSYKYKEIKEKYKLFD